jgi:hypothetical protein
MMCGSRNLKRVCSGRRTRVHGQTVLNDNQRKLQKEQTIEVDFLSAYLLYIFLRTKHLLMWSVAASSNPLVGSVCLTGGLSLSMWKNPGWSIGLGNIYYFT